MGQNSVDDAVSYSYDARSRLQGADYDSSTIADESYTYDENGNRVNANGSTYATADQNRMTSDGTYTYEYDNEGNRTLRYIDDNGTRTDITQYQWDGRNRLVGIVRRDSEAGPATFSETLTYDLFNRWIGRSVDADGDGEGAAVDTHFVYDGSQMVLEFQGAQTADLTHRYLWGAGTDPLIADEKMAVSGGNLTTDGVLWALGDQIGSVRDLVQYDDGTDTTSVVNHRIFDAYGGLTDQSDPNVACLFGFTGRAFDDGSGLQNNLNRWYDAAVGGWVSEDPIGFELQAQGAGAPVEMQDAMGPAMGRTLSPYRGGYSTGNDDGLNLQRYVGNGPMGRTDPGGLDPLTVTDGGLTVTWDSDKPTLHPQNVLSLYKSAWSAIRHPGAALRVAAVGAVEQTIEYEKRRMANPTAHDVGVVLGVADKASSSSTAPLAVRRDVGELIAMWVDPRSWDPAGEYHPEEHRAINQMLNPGDYVLALPEDSRRAGMAKIKAKLVAAGLDEATLDDGMTVGKIGYDVVVIVVTWNPEAMFGEATNLAGAGVRTGAVVTDGMKAGRLGGDLYGEARLAKLDKYLGARKITLVPNQDVYLAAKGRAAQFVSFPDGTGSLFLKSDPTKYEVWHELGHMRHRATIGVPAYMAPTMDETMKEQFVFDLLRGGRHWSLLNDAQQAHAIYYVVVSDGVGLAPGPMRK